MFLTQAQYVFIHDIIKHKLESLGYGMTSVTDTETEDDAVGQSKFHLSYHQPVAGLPFMFLWTLHMISSL